MGRLARFLALVALGLALVGSAAPGPPVAPAPEPSTVDPIPDLLGLINEARHDAGLSPLTTEPALVKLAAERAADAAITGDFDGTADTVMACDRELHRAGYHAFSWRQRLVQGPADAPSLVQQWRRSDAAGFDAIALGDFEGFGAALAPSAVPPLWSVVVALPRITWERREAAPLDDVATVRDAVLAAVNRERAAKGRSPLAIEPRLERAAQAHAADMAARRFYDHKTPEGRDLGWRMGEAGYHYRWAAENIAKGVFVPDEVVRRWMLSSDHRRNILDPHAVQVGVGVVRSEESGEVTALWVLDFAAPV